MTASQHTSSRVHALWCALVFIAAAMGCRPFAETGIYDDWSYVRTAELLAQTGHIHYNGWATAMLGWQLYPAALFMRVFGPSFTVARMTTIAVAAVTAYLMHQCCTRLGCRPWNATVGTLTLVLSPLFLPLATTFMSDVFGLLAIVACLYCCVRALNTGPESAARWLAMGAVVNVVGGTARQIAWLGLLVMVPSTAWLLRRQRKVVLTGVVCWVCGFASILMCMRWFAHQPYAVPEIFPHARLGADALLAATWNLLRLVMELGLLILPLLVGFFSALTSNRRWLVLTALLGAILAGCALVAHHFVHHMGQFLVPTLLDGGNYVGPQGIPTAWPEHGGRPTLLPDGLRLLLTLVVLFGFFAVGVSARMRVRAHESGETQQKASWRTVLVLTGPFAVAYLLFLTPRAAFFHPYDRYSLPLIAVLLVPLIRLYEEKLGARMPFVSLASLVVFGLYSVAATHDAFAMYRGTHAAVGELLSAGVPATAIDAGWEYSGWTQIVEGGYAHDLRLKLPEDRGHLYGPDLRPCSFDLKYLFPVVEPEFALAFQPDGCGGRAPYPAVTYRTWLPWSIQTIYVVHDAAATQPGR